MGSNGKGAAHRRRCERAVPRWCGGRWRRVGSGVPDGCWLLTGLPCPMRLPGAWSRSPTTRPTCPMCVGVSTPRLACCRGWWSMCGRRSAWRNKNGVGPGLSGTAGHRCTCWGSLRNSSSWLACASLSGHCPRTCHRYHWSCSKGPGRAVRTDRAPVSPAGHAPRDCHPARTSSVSPTT